MTHTNDPAESIASLDQPHETISVDSRDGWPARAIIAGAAASVIGGGAWALIAVLGNLEVGYVAWGIGFLVGWAMMRSTDYRGSTPAATAAALAAVGLISGKLLIVELMTGGRLVEEVTSTPELMEQAAFFDLQVTNGWSDSVLQGLSTLGETDTIPDVLWDVMRTEMGRHANEAPVAERERMASAFAEAMVADVGLVERIRSQLSPYDLLWFGLALTTAWRMLRGRPEPVA